MSTQNKPCKISKSFDAASLLLQMIALIGNPTGSSTAVLLSHRPNVRTTMEFLTQILRRQGLLYVAMVFVPGAHGVDCHFTEDHVITATSEICHSVSRCLIHILYLVANQRLCRCWLKVTQHQQRHTRPMFQITRRCSQGWALTTTDLHTLEADRLLLQMIELIWNPTDSSTTVLLSRKPNVRTTVECLT